MQSTTMTMTIKMVICLFGCSKSPTEEKQRTQDVTVQKGTTEGKCVAGPVLTRSQVKKTEIHPSKVKEAMSNVDKSIIEDLQKEDSTLKKCFD